MRLLATLAAFVILFSFTAVGQNKNYSFNSKDQFDGFVKFINDKQTDGSVYFNRIYSKVQGDVDLSKDFKLHPDTAIFINEGVLIIYNIQQVGALARTIKYILLYSVNGDFKNALAIRSFYEDSSDGATHYFYGNYKIENDEITISETRRNHLVSELKNVPRGEEIFYSFISYKIDNKFIFQPTRTFTNKTEVFYPSESLVHLESLSVDELRIVRNYFFAKHDYDFSDPELEKFFLENLMYYKPTYSDVSDKLSENEKMIVQYIKELESKK